MDLEVALSASSIVLSTENFDFRSLPFNFTVFYLSVLTSGLRQEGRPWLGCCCLGAEGESTNELSSSGLVFLANRLKTAQKQMSKEKSVKANRKPAEKVT